MTVGSAMVIQMGARRNYIYARQLEQAGLLHSLVTDMAWAESDSSWGAALGGVAPSVRGAVARRTVSGVPASKLKATILPNLARSALWWRDPEDRFVAADEALALACRMRGLGDAQIIVNYLGNGGSFLEYARARGSQIVTDFAITPRQYEIEQEERRLWPDWETVDPTGRGLDVFKQKMEWLVRISDVYICPSATVARDLEKVKGFDHQRVRLLPYGFSSVLQVPARPDPGRVLFAGAAGLRKGTPYLAEAAHLLSKSASHHTFVVAGEASQNVRERPETRHLRFLGILSREAIASEFARADVFCLPSLAEGSPTSIFEALSYGVPVVTTPSSGSVVQDGIEGFVVAERDSRAIAEAVQRITQNRDLRRRMSEAALVTAARYSDQACGAAFVDVIRDLVRK